LGEFKLAMLKRILIVSAVIGIALTLFLTYYVPALPENHGHVETKLFLSESENQPLVVAFGGSEGGNIFASDKLKNDREKFLQRGYAFLAVGYFGTESTPPSLDRISLNGIHDSILSVIDKHPKIDKRKVVLYGGSRGGELVLNLASRYQDYSAVIAVVPSNVSLPTRFGWGETSSWTFDDKEVRYISSRAANGDFFSTLSKMLEDEEAVHHAAIPVERINGPILLLSATNDEVWPSTLMCNKIVERLQSQHFRYSVEHIPLEGSHAAPAGKTNDIFNFLSKHFKDDEP
jgi:dipeptidyl aminopeptidase/acylaminoacyl peptidase